MSEIVEIFDFDGNFGYVPYGNEKQRAVEYMGDTYIVDTENFGLKNGFRCYKVSERVDKDRAIISPVYDDELAKEVREEFYNLKGL